MKQKIEALRKLAVKMLLSGEKIKEVCERTGFSKFWVYKWYKRYLKGDKLWFKEHSRAPYSIPHKTPPEIEQAVISIRKRLQQKDGFKGAQDTMGDGRFKLRIYTINKHYKRYT